MSNYDSFYFLHVPKTAGRFLTKYVFEPIYPILEKNGIEILKPTSLENSNKKNRHVGWREDIKDSTYIVSCFREPISWACSFFTHIKFRLNNALDLDNEAIVKKDIDIETNEILEWIHDNIDFSNYQSKNFLLGADPVYSTINREIGLSYSNNEKINIEKLHQRLNRINILLKQDDLKAVDYNKIINKISLDLGIEIDYRVPDDADRKYYSNSASNSLYGRLNHFERGVLETLFDIDIQTYNNDKLFWSTK